mmetsp:Transcript_5020/g.10838  ORF Transcript_5020/g.10838 Transcript_5020/m.10838 type:complete len:321 (-) Transcript_5020:493-1455(-)
MAASTVSKADSMETPKLVRINSRLPRASHANEARADALARLASFEQCSVTDAVATSSTSAGGGAPLPFDDGFFFFSFFSALSSRGSATETVSARRAPTGSTAPYLTRCALSTASFASLSTTTTALSTTYALKAFKHLMMVGRRSAGSTFRKNSNDAVKCEMHVQLRPCVVSASNVGFVLTTSSSSSSFSFSSTFVSSCPSPSSAVAIGLSGWAAHAKRALNRSLDDTAVWYSAFAHTFSHNFNTTLRMRPPSVTSMSSAASGGIAPGRGSGYWHFSCMAHRKARVRRSIEPSCWTKSPITPSSSFSTITKRDSKTRADDN